jgi:iron complex transport system substrate-binding protein
VLRVHVLAVAAGLCTASLAAESPSVTVTDFRGKTVRLRRPATRIVCLIESALTGLYMLHAEDRVAGVPAMVYKGDVAPHYAALDPRIRQKQLPAPGNWDFVNVETVVGLQPDLVIIWAQQKEPIASLEEKGIPVYGVELAGFADIYREIADLAALTGTEKRGKELTAYTQAEVKRFRERVRKLELEPVKTYFMWAQGPLETAGRKSTANELLELAGARNACPLQDEHVVANLEKVLTWNPELIVMWTNAAKDPADILALGGWRSVSAIRNKRVHELPSAFFCDFWTLKFQYAVKTVAKWCHPKAFADVRLEDERRRMLETLYGTRGLKLVE